MFKRIVVPLDGSKLAENILPAVQQLAMGLNARVDLIAVVDEQAVAPEGGWRADDVAKEAVNKAERYLQSIAPLLRLPEGRVQTKATVSRVAEGIAEEAGRERDTLTAMSTHGRTGIGRFLLGSVADKVLHETTTPLLLYRPATGSAPSQTKTVIVPLDGSPLAEKALVPATELAKALKLKLALVRARQTIPTYGGNLGVDWYDPRLDAEDRKAVEAYLADQVRQLKSGGLDASGEAIEGAAASAIVDYAKATPDAMVVMTTRGRSGAGRAVLGSVADRVVGHANAPVLLVHA